MVIDFGFSVSKVSAVCNIPEMDFNGDLHVDSNDYDVFTVCYNGPANPAPAGCSCADVNDDSFVDTTDYDAFSGCYNGPTNPPSCMPDGMVLIPAGAFNMGDAFNEGFTDERELPVHNVYTDAFYMDQNEVTNQQYATALNWALNLGDQISVDMQDGKVYRYNTGTNFPYCSVKIGETGSSRIAFIDGEFVVVSEEKEEHPVTYVSWFGAVAYAN